MASACDTELLAWLIRSCTAALTTGFSAASAGVVDAGQAVALQPARKCLLIEGDEGADEGTVVADDQYLGTSASARIWSSSRAGTTFLPPAVTMISFLRPVIVRKPSSSSWPMSPVRNQPSTKASAVRSSRLK